MAAILGLGVTHFPPLSWRDENMADLLRMLERAPGVEARWKDRAAWPAEMLAELDGDEGLAAARRHRERLVEGFRRCRRALDAFAPDFVVIFGDDQYENFREDLIPPFCVFGLDEIVLRPWAGGAGALRPNRWGEPAQWSYRARGHREGARAIARGLLERGVDLPYAYRPLHHEGLAHAFTNTLLYFDWERRGFPHAVVPFHVNCYGAGLLSTRGGFGHLMAPRDAAAAPPPDPPAPSPRRCMEVGARLAETIAESPWRVALVASSSWSHAFLTARNGYLWPDREADRRLFEALRRGDLAAWREQPLEEYEAAGQHELLNWCVLLGAMERLGRRAEIVDWIETFVFNSNKCFAVFGEEASA
jgi:catalytic LigB subunit of aromatic ring-opening dioxygenase